MVDELKRGGKKPCSTCAEEINSQAKKCTKCGSYQDFRRFIAGSGAAISVAAAIVSVFGAIAPELGGMLIPKYAKPEISLVGATQGMLTLAIRNPGTKPIYVDGAGLNFGKGRSVGTIRLEMLQREVVGAPIYGQTTRNLTFLTFGNIGPFKTADSNCLIYISYGGHSDQVEIAMERVSCVRLAGLNDST